MLQAQAIMRASSTWQTISFVACLVTLAGCVQSDRVSLHEDDHHQPAHWPNDLEDAANKLEERLSRLAAEKSTETIELSINDRNRHSENAFTELRELIGWAPEIAADSVLTEDEWLPIHQDAEALLKSATSISSIQSQDASNAIRQLAKRLREAHQICLARAPRTDDDSASDLPVDLPSHQESLK